MTNNIDILGQVFTPVKIADMMVKLIENKGSILEPSCGAGVFCGILPGITAIEYDKNVAHQDAIVMDFFDFSIENKFHTIIGNPPYVKFRSIQEDTKNKLDMKLFDHRSNLYLFFIEKCIKHLAYKGELIFIVPRDFLKSTSAIKMNKWLYTIGTITHVIDFGDEMIFPGYTPNCIIFRFEKDNFNRIAYVNEEVLDFTETNGQLIFSNTKHRDNFSDYFYVKVGGASGANKLFISPNGNKDMVFSETAITGKTIKMHYNTFHEELLENKELLLQRKLKQFNETNWYMWGRNYHASDLPRIYLNSKTRNLNPFFLHASNAYDGSVLAVFPKFKIKDDSHLQEVCNMLNNIKWNEAGFVCDGRFLFTQKALENSQVEGIDKDLCS